MEVLLDVLDELRVINEKYDNNVDKIDGLEKEITEARVCVPLIGKFSTGKTALVNSLLDIRNTGILKEDITPETAVATEIVYSDCDEYVEINYLDGNKEKLSINEYREFEIEAEKVKSVRIYINNDFLSEIRDVMLVDLPGFESGYEIHNKAIDNYAGNSMAYILAVPADDMIIKRSVGNILKELGMTNMRICVAITKYDKANVYFEETLDNLKENLKKYIGDDLVEYSITSSRSGEFDDIKSFLYDIQNNSGELIYKYYKDKVLYELNNTKSYLDTRIKRMDLSESDLEEEKEYLERSIDKINEKFYVEKDRFDNEIMDAIEDVKADVRNSLYSNRSKFATMVLNKQNINEEINYLIRNTIRRSVYENIVPKFEKYLKKVERCVDENMLRDFPINIQVEEKGFREEIISSVVAVAAGSLLGISIPIIGILAVIGAKLIGDYKREEMKREVENKLDSEVFSKIINDVGASIGISIRDKVQMVNNKIEEDINEQKENILKSIEDIKKKIDDENEEKERCAEEIKKNITTLEELSDELQ